MNSSEYWFYAVDPPASGLENMRVDRFLLQQAEQESRPRTWLRFYQWQVPTVSVGRNQTFQEAADLDYCAAHGIPLVRRPSGGGGVYHDRELTYSLVSNDTRHFPSRAIGLTCRRIAEALSLGLSRLGIAARLLERPRAGGRPGGAPCFAAPGRYELMVEGRKLVGSAQRRLRRAFLQHGSLPLTLDYGGMAAALGSSTVLLQARATSVCRAAGRPIDFATLSRTLGRAFQDYFGVKLVGAVCATGSPAALLRDASVCYK